MTASAIEEKCLNFIITLTKDSRLKDESWPTLPVEKQSEILKELVRGIEYDGQKGKLWIELMNDFTKHQFDLPLDQLKQKLPDTAGIAFANEPLIRKQLLLAHQIQGMLADGRAKDLKQIAIWTGINRFRLYQIVNLLYLSPSIQEEILAAENNRLVKITERNIRHISNELDWQKQASLWQQILK